MLGRERLLGLEPDGLGVADEHRDADARGAERELGQLEDLARLLAQLRLLLELDAVEVPVHREVASARLLRAQPLHRLRAGARRRLVRRDAHAPQPGGSRSGASTQARGIAEQFGFATMPSCSAARSPFTSGTTSGTPSVSRNAVDLSTQTAPPRTAWGTSSRLAAEPTEKRQRSTSARSSESGVASSTRTPSISVPAERADAKRRTSS